MGKSITLTASVIAVILTTAAPAQADTARTLCEKDKLADSYSANYYSVAKLHGKRAPGRNIRKWGLSTERKSRCKDLRASRDTLRRMRMPASSARLLTATTPYVPPAQTATLRAPAGGLAACIRGRESGDGYSTNTGNGYSGAYQFDDSTWKAAGGSTAHAYQASPAEQDAAFARWYPGHPSAWPNTGPACGG